MNRFVLAGLLAAPLLCVCSVGASAAVFELDRQMYRNIYGPGCLRPDHMLTHGGFVCWRSSLTISSHANNLTQCV